MPGWPEWADALVEQARAGTSGATLERAAAAVREGALTDEQGAYLAALGLAELATWADRLDDDPDRPCAGEAVARARYAGMQRYLQVHAPSWAARAEREP